MTDFPDDMTLGEARAKLRELATTGHDCPVCTQFVKVYRRKLPSATARVMIALYKINQGREYIFLPELLDTMTGTPHQGGYGTLGVYWGLLERKPDEVREDGSNRVGWWRLTDLGRQFVTCSARVQSHARIYNSRCLGLTGDLITISEALGTKFNYAELMTA